MKALGTCIISIVFFPLLVFATDAIEVAESIAWEYPHSSVVFDSDKLEKNFHEQFAQQIEVAKQSYYHSVNTPEMYVLLSHAIPSEYVRRMVEAIEHGDREQIREIFWSVLVLAKLFRGKDLIASENRAEEIVWLITIAAFAGGFGATILDDPSIRNQLIFPMVMQVTTVLIPVFAAIYYGVLQVKADNRDKEMKDNRPEIFALKRFVEHLLDSLSPPEIVKMQNLVRCSTALGKPAGIRETF